MAPHIDQISHDLIGVAMRLHSEIGPGLLESVYETLLAGRLSMMGYKVERQKPISIIFDGIEFGEVARVDLLIEDHREFAVSSSTTKTL
jgi:GxxExxY protein